MLHLCVAAYVFVCARTLAQSQHFEIVPYNSPETSGAQAYGVNGNAVDGMRGVGSKYEMKMN